MRAPLAVSKGYLFTSLVPPPPLVSSASPGVVVQCIPQLTVAGAWKKEAPAYKFGVEDDSFGMYRNCVDGCNGHSVSPEDFSRAICWLSAVCQMPTVATKVVCECMPALNPFTPPFLAFERVGSMWLVIFVCGTGTGLSYFMLLFSFGECGFFFPNRNGLV